MTEPGGEDISAGWSRDGRFIYFNSNRTGTWQLWKRPASGGASTQVTTNGAGGGRATESPDGKFLYYRKSHSDTGVDGSLWRMSLKGGEETKILDQVFGSNFEVTRDGVYFVPSAHWLAINYLDLKTGRVKTVFTFRRPAKWGLSLAPDNSSILFTIMVLPEAVSDLMLIENFH